MQSSVKSRKISRNPPAPPAAEWAGCTKEPKLARKGQLTCLFEGRLVTPAGLLISENSMCTHKEVQSSSPALIAYLQPFRIIENNELKWECTVEQVNDGSYDSGKLARIVGSIDVGLPKPYCLHVGLDGALILPRIDQLDPYERAADFLNGFLAALTIGGALCGAVGPDDIELCHVIDNKVAWYFGPGQTFSSLLHGGFKYKSAGHIMPIMLVNPSKIDFGEIVEAHAKGQNIVSRASIVSPEFVTRGLSAFRARTWGACVAELWVVVEQLTTVLWKRALEKIPNPSISRRQEMLDDHRTWTTAVRHEVLFQQQELDALTYENLFAARKARNDLSHKGIRVARDRAAACVRGVLRLLSLASFPGSPSSLDELVSLIIDTPTDDRLSEGRSRTSSAEWAPVGAVANSHLYGTTG
jgi:hypothetical protein